jgi:hypothetical protein
MVKRIRFGGLNADGSCPAQRVSPQHAARVGVRDRAARTPITEIGVTTCHRCGRTVPVKRRFDEPGRPGWSVWRYEPHSPVRVR